MKIVENPKIHRYLSGSKVIGVGNTAICFLLNDGRVLKLYYNLYNKKLLFGHIDMISRFNDINYISNDSYIGPDELLVKNGEFIGYLYPYVKAKTLLIQKYFITLNEIINKYSKLFDDTKKVSQKKFILSDLHDMNILVGSLLYIIDLDQGYIDKDLSYEQAFLYNMREINRNIVYSLFGVKSNELIDFYDDNINELYHNSVGLYPQDFFKLLEKLNENCYPKKSSVLNLRRSVPYNKSYNSYYRYF